MVALKHSANVEIPYPVELQRTSSHRTSLRGLVRSARTVGIFDAYGLYSQRTPLRSDGPVVGKIIY